MVANEAVGAAFEPCLALLGDFRRGDFLAGGTGLRGADALFNEGEDADGAGAGAFREGKFEEFAAAEFRG